MANEKISQMPLISTFASGDLFPIVDISEASAADRNKSVTFGELFRNVLGGSASDPSIAFTGDQNTGIYSPGADQVAVATNGAGRLFVDSAGLVGIGSSTPTQRLTVAGNILTASAAGTDSYINVATTGVQNTYLGFNNSGSTNTNAVLNNYSYVGAGNPYGLQLLANGTPAVTIDTSQRVGIGTTSPSTTLSIGASASSSYNGGVCLNRGPSTYNFYEASDGTNSVIFGLDNTLTTAKIGSVNSYPLGFFTSNTEKARIDASGRFLVGTSTVTTTASSSTNNLLAVESANNYLGVSFTANCNDSNGSYLVLKKSRGTIAGSTTVVQSGDEIGNIFFEATDGSASRSAAAIRAFVDATPGANDMPGRLVFSTTSDGASSPTERLRIDSSGRVGIGTTSPIAFNPSLTIEGTDPGFFISNSAATDFYSINVQSGVVSTWVKAGAAFAIGRASGITGAGYSESLRIDSSGRLLVGTSSTSKDFSAVFQGNSADATGGANLLLARGTSSPADGSAIGYLSFTDSNHNTAALIQAQRDGGTWDSGASQPGRLVFSTTANGAGSPTERMRINAVGALKASLDGTYESATSSYHELRTQGSGDWIAYFTQTSASSPNGVVIKYSAAAPNTSGSTFLYCEDTVGLKASIRSNGGIANFTANDANLSDRNVKKDIGPAGDTWDCVRQWEIVNYRYKDQPDVSDLNIGVIAQQVAESCPEVITVFEEAKDDQPERLGVKEQQMYWMAIKALQEAQVRIEQLEQRLTDAGIA
jgi:hypothetical protein